ncbi:MAG: ABC transporter ATP-binding protein/permease [Peptococcaceae bacterium]|jgi:ATP-binding cassette subfamily B protein|nr:ABC transporter ATP-binding protein/permease [Peptococcaceae bacterium]
MTATQLVKQIKARNRASNLNMFISVAAGLGTTLLAVLLLYLYREGGLTRLRIWQIGGGMAALQIAKAVFYAVGLWKAHEAAYQSLAELRLAIVNHMRKLPIGFFQKRRAGDLANIVNHDVEQIEVYLAHTQPEVIATTLAAVLMAGIIFIADWRLALCVLGALAGMLLLLALLFMLWDGRIKRYNQSTKEMAEGLMEYIAVMPAVKAFAKSETKTDALTAFIKNYVKTTRRMITGVSIPQGLLTAVLQGGVLLVVTVGLHLLTEGGLTLTRFILALVLSNAFAAAMIKYTTYEHAGIILKRSAENIVSILGEEPVPASDRLLTDGDIELRQVTFSYDERETALKDVTIAFKKGATSAIVGSSGSGKSTIANLIMGFWRAEIGQVTIGGTDIAAVGEDTLTSLISIVQQESFLFNTSIAENIAIGRRGASREEIIAAAQTACIHEMIEALPQGYDTLAGEAGAKLSGGEKQRIAIARVILKNAPVIILDEATAAIDPYNEHLIQQAIVNMSRGKTLIVIAHHLRTIRGADNIIVMDSGCVAATGTHEELMQNCALYREMTAAQEQVDAWELAVASNGSSYALTEKPCMGAVGQIEDLDSTSKEGA